MVYIDMMEKALNTTKFQPELWVCCKTEKEIYGYVEQVDYIELIRMAKL